MGPLPETSRGNKWILVLTDHFSRWQNALALPDATAPTVATQLDERVFCYLGLPEQIHSDQGAQFESQLMTELCRLWGVEKTGTTPYHPKSNGQVERNNRVLGDSLRALLVQGDQEGWDLLLPHLMRTFRGTPNTTTGETANSLMLGRELRLPDQLVYDIPLQANSIQQQYVTNMYERLKTAHILLQEQQQEIRTADRTEPLLFQPGDLVWLENRRRRKGENPKLTSKYVGPYTIVDSRPNHTYLINKDRQESWQNECRLKLFRPCEHPSGKAPYTTEPSRRPNMKGAVRKRQTTGGSGQVTYRDQLLDELLPPAVLAPPLPTATPQVEEDNPELSNRSDQSLTGQDTPPQDPTQDTAPGTGVRQDTLPQEIVEVPSHLPAAVD